MTAAEPYAPPKRTAPAPDPADLRRGRWYDTNPITSTNTSTGGTGVATIGEARGGILAANEKANGALGALQQARTDLEEAVAMLQHAGEGTGQADVSRAVGLLAKAGADAEAAQHGAAAGISEAESVAARL